MRHDRVRGIESIDLAVRTPRPPGSARREALAVDGLWSTLASYSGHLRWGGAWRAWQRVWSRHPWLATLYECEGWNVRFRWNARS